MLLACGEQVADIELVVPEGGSTEGVVFEVVAARGACPDLEGFLEGASNAVVDPVSVEDGAPVVPEWSELDDGHVAIALGRDEDCAIRFFGCARLVEGAVAVALENVVGDERCSAEQVCSASRCVDWPDPGAAADPSELVSLCGYPPGGWRFDAPEPVRGLSTSGVAERLPSAWFSETWGLERFAVRNEPGCCEAEVVRALGAGAPQRMRGSVAIGVEGRAVPFGRDAEYLMLSRQDEDHWFIGEGPRSDEGNGISSYAERGYGETRPERRHPFPEVDGRALWHSELVDGRHWDVTLYERRDLDDFEWAPSFIGFDRVNTEDDEGSIAVSRDRGWIVFESNRSGRMTLYFALLGGEGTMAAAYSAAYPLTLPGMEDDTETREPFLLDTEERAACGLYVVGDRDDAAGDVFLYPIVAR